MDGIGVLKSAFGGAYMWYQGTVADVTEAQANTVPPAVLHPIGELMPHILHCEDFMVNTAIQGKRSLWERGSCGAKLGGEMVVDLPIPVKGRAYRCDPKAMAEYAEAVFANTDAFPDSLKDSELKRDLELVQFGFPNNMGLGAFLTTMLLGNTYAHTGEISALKGLLGAKGCPF